MMLWQPGAMPQSTMAVRFWRFASSSSSKQSSLKKEMSTRDLPASSTALVVLKPMKPGTAPTTRSAFATAAFTPSGFERSATRVADLSNPEGVKAAVANADLVVGAVPGFMGFNTTKAVLEAGKSLVDISFFNEDCFELDELAKGQNLTAIVDCDIAP